MCYNKCSSGLQVTQNPDSEITTLEKCQREVMKQIQHLPIRVSSPITYVYLLAGILPIKATLHKRILTTFCSMLRHGNTAEYRIIKKQLALKVKKLLYQYHLPSAFVLMLEPPNKETWKKSVTKAVHQYHKKELKTQAATQSTCRYINLIACSVTILSGSLLFHTHVKSQEPV